MLIMSQIFSVMNSRMSISPEPRRKDVPAGSYGFTLLELIISMTIISMIVLVLYFAFSIGVRTWESDESADDIETRLEATLRLIEDDFRNIVPYDMNWERGALTLFAGGPRTVFYVTGNGTGAVSGAGAGLFFSMLYVDECPETSDNCLFLYKSPVPSPEFVRAVDGFKDEGELRRGFFSPGTEIAEESILVLEGLIESSFSYSSEGFIPFAGTEHEETEQSMLEEDVLSEESWTSEELPGQARVAFVFEDREFAVQVQVGE